GQINFGDQDNLPSVAFYDVQYDQNEGVNQIIQDHGLEIIQNVPIVTMRLQSINGLPTSDIQEDTSSNARGWALMREYRSTYRDTLLKSESLVHGEWIGKVENLDTPVPISVEQDLMEDLDAEIGDTLTWNVQG